ncbi:hypothetical protein B0A58_02425 [Flavobacterium branchiophilum NBRC 15030 = ATCC 35035]|uniref:Uncharacterized protein n=1 Tax=Flavobacterium branchiophilum TaxID=55197 RepID=A0A543G2B0_9FLAO|nr:hypothetical protein [Flavobacterium branchiophilum]OXA80472.1 hypothetical protein B0A58_02425 [Flavobacterium branchiophilum NBRC 15030 = ATCC 35035]TQM40175.1 hypothetical protein BC670_1047 [Flavobacterium branchiophilum]GEM56118.1 hypothetical protein FB1_23390 [Flavobacterium branchiophilum NBRC 15030 = ATCC 35035]
MERRKFIKQTTFAIAGISMIPHVISCSGKTLDISELLGKINQNLLDFSKEGNDFFSYYSLENHFKHEFIKGNQAFLFEQQNKIVGFTIKEEGTSNAENYIEKLTSLYGQKNKVIDNLFGTEYLWKAKNKNIKLCYTKPYEGLEQNMHYSEYDANSKLIVF